MALAAAGLALVAVPGAEAATYNVVLDSDSLAPCVGTSCNFRAAVTKANANAGPDEIVFDLPAGSTIDLVNGPITANVGEGDELTITGPGEGGVTLTGNGRLNFSGSDANQVFDSEISGLTFDDTNGLNAANADVLMRDMVFRDHDSSAVIGGGDGRLRVVGSLFENNQSNAGGAINSQGRLEVVNSDFSGNFSDYYFAPYGNYGFGGTISAFGSTLIQGSTITDGYAVSNGGAIEAGGDIRIEDSVLSGNESSAGGAISTGFGVEMEIVRTRITANGGYRGAGLNFGNGTLTVQDSEFSGNIASSAGGAISIAGSDANAVISNTTISQNQANGVVEGASGGGGIRASGDDVELGLRSTTITDNTAALEGGGVRVLINDGTGLNDVVTLNSTVVAGNTSPGADDVAGDADTGDPNGVVVASHSFFGEVEAGTVVGGVPAVNSFGGAPGLGPLLQNGGPTFSHLPADGSPLIDAGNSAGLNADQRGLERPSDLAAPNAPGGDGSDIGAVEVQAPNTAPDTAFVKTPKKKLKSKKKRKRVTWKFSGSDDYTPAGQLSFECKLDKKKYRSCSSPYKKKLKKGRHRLSVRAVDESGLVDPSPAKSKVKIKLKKGKKGKRR